MARSVLVLSLMAAKGLAGPIGPGLVEPRLHHFARAGLPCLQRLDRSVSGPDAPSARTQRSYWTARSVDPAYFRSDARNIADGLKR